MKIPRALTPFAVAALFTLFAAGAALAEGVRPEVGKPLQQAAQLLKAGKGKEALAKVQEAEAVGGLTAYERQTIDGMKASAAQRAGDLNTAVQALESLAGKSSGAQLGSYAEQIASTYAQMRNNAKANEWVNKAVAAGNNGPGIKRLQTYLLNASGDYAAIARDAAAAVSAAEKAGRRPDENELLRLADAQQRTNSTAAYIQTLEKLLSHYPKKDYWSAYLGRLPRKAGFADRFALDVLRLRLSTGTVSSTEDFMEMAQLALQDGLPAEALRITDQGIKSGALGTGAEAARHQRLRDLAVKRLGELKAGIAAQTSEAMAAKSGEDLVKVGYTYVSLGDVNKGIELIDKGIAKGGLKRPEDAKLRLGMAQLQSPKTKSAAVKTLRSVKGSDGVADIARLWIILGAS